jgi:hypothetical protein
MRRNKQLRGLYTPTPDTGEKEGSGRLRGSSPLHKPEFRSGGG